MVTQITMKATLRSLSSTFTPTHKHRHRGNGTEMHRRGILSKQSRMNRGRPGENGQRIQNIQNAAGASSRTANARVRTAMRAAGRGLRPTLALKVPAARFPARRRKEASAFCSLSGSIVLVFLCPYGGSPAANARRGQELGWLSLAQHGERLQPHARFSLLAVRAGSRPCLPPACQRGFAYVASLSSYGSTQGNS